MCSGIRAIPSDMTSAVTDHVFDGLDRRLIAALQCDGRITAERAADVLGLPTRVVAAPPRPPLQGVMLLRIRVLRGRVDAVAKALAAREDIPLIDVCASGDQLSAVLLAAPDHRNRLVFRQLPATGAVTSVEAETVLHVYGDAGDWRLDALSPEERLRLTPQRRDPDGDGDSGFDAIDRALVAVLADNARISASAAARAVGHPESTVRRRLTALFEQGHLLTRVVVDPQRLGLGVDANLRMQVPAARLDATGRTLAAHPAVHGALATTGRENLTIAVWLRDIEHLYRFLTHDLAELDVANVDTVLIGESLKRPLAGWPHLR